MENEMEKVKTDKISDSDLIWNDIKDLPLDLYGLQGQTVGMNVFKLDLNLPNSLYVKLKSTGVLPSLEQTLNIPIFAKNFKYELEQAADYIIIKRDENKEVKIAEAINKIKK